MLKERQTDRFTAYMGQIFLNRFRIQTVYMMNRQISMSDLWFFRTKISKFDIMLVVGGVPMPIDQGYMHMDAFLSAGVMDKNIDFIHASSACRRRKASKGEAGQRSGWGRSPKTIQAGSASFSVGHRGSALPWLSVPLGSPVRMKLTQ